MHDLRGREFDVPLSFRVHLVPEGCPLHHVVELPDAVGERCVLVYRRMKDVRDGIFGIEGDSHVVVWPETDEFHPQRNEDGVNVRRPARPRRMAQHRVRECDTSNRER